MRQPIHAFLFDMDGVIFDSEQVYYDAFYLVAEKHALTVDDAFVRSFSGKTSQTVLLMLKSLFDGDEDKTMAFVRDWGLARQGLLADNGLPFKNGFLALFDAIHSATVANNPSHDRAYALGLVTSAPRRDVESNFSRNNSSLLKQFDAIITVDDVAFPKPHPEPYQMMMARLGRAPQECIVIEDSLTGATAAIQAGAQTIMINATPPPAEIEAQLLLRVTHHDEILAYLKAQQLL